MQYTASYSSGVKLQPAELINAISLLTPRELSEFVLRFDEWHLTRITSVDEQAAQIADEYRLSAVDRLRVSDLLVKNREEGLSEQEESELDSYMVAMDERLDEVTDRLLKLASH